MSEKHFNVFISYAAEDREQATKIAERCASRGLETWLADWHLKPGQDWRSEVDEAIDRSNLCVVLLSAATTPHSPWVSREWSAIQQNVWEKSDFTILPVQLDRDVELPAFLREWRRVVASDSDDGADQTGERVAEVILSGSTGRSEEASESETRERFQLLFQAIERLASEETEGQ